MDLFANYSFWKAAAVLHYLLEHFIALGVRLWKPIPMQLFYRLKQAYFWARFIIDRLVLIFLIKSLNSGSLSYYKKLILYIDDNLLVIKIADIAGTVIFVY